MIKRAIKQNSPSHHIPTNYRMGTGINFQKHTAEGRSIDLTRRVVIQGNTEK